MIDLSNPDSLLETEFSIEETRFVIGKMKAMEGFACLERIRVQLGQSSDWTGLAEKVSEDKEIASKQRFTALMRSVLALPAMFIESLRVQLFKHIRFQNAHAVTLAPLIGNEDSAFDELEPSAIYEVLARSLAVNFTPSFRGVVETISKLGSLESTSNPSLPEG